VVTAMQSSASLPLQMWKIFMGTPCPYGLIGLAEWPGWLGLVAQRAMRFRPMHGKQPRLLWDGHQLVGMDMPKKPAGSWRIEGGTEMEPDPQVIRDPVC